MKATSAKVPAVAVILLKSSFELCLLFATSNSNWDGKLEGDVKRVERQVIQRLGEHERCQRNGRRRQRAFVVHEVGQHSRALLHLLVLRMQLVGPINVDAFYRQLCGAL